MSDETPLSPPGPRGYVKFSAKLARAICARLAAGETQLAIVRDPAMPSRHTLSRWARDRPDFAKIFARAKAMGGRNAMGRPSTYCPVAAHEIAVRVSEGETLTAISGDPSLPSMGTIFYWRKSHPEFADALKHAREVLAERFCDLGWEMAMGATPKTAHLIRVQLGQLRWTAGILSPRTHGKLKATEPPEPRKEQTVLLRHFQLEVHPETGQHRVVGFCPHPGTMQPVRDSQGEWTDPPEVIRGRHAKYVGSICVEPPSIPVDRDDPEGWC